MARTGRALAPDLVKRWINESAVKEGIALDEKKISVIDSILATLLPQPNPTHISIWCNHQVKDILAAFPGYQAEARILCIQVRKEILYFLNEEEFKRLSVLLTEEKIKKIQPQWIRQKSYGLYLSIKRAFRTIDGKIDWQFVFDRLGTKKFSYRDKQSYLGDKGKIISRLTELLEKEEPSIFNPTWITKRSGSIVKQIDIVFENNWSEVVSLLGAKWSSRFTHQRIPKEIKVYKGTAEFRKFIKENGRKLYVLYSAANAQEKKTRNQLALGLIDLSQKGNKMAFDFLVDSLMLTIQVDDSFIAWHGFEFFMKDKIRSCIFLFDERKGANFFNYLYTALRRAVLPIRGINSFSINASVKNSKLEITEFLLSDYSAESADFEESIRLVMAKN